MAIKVALAGATGNLGPAILQALLAAGFEVIILTRQGSSSADSLPAHPNQKVVSVNYRETSNLTSALRGVDVVVSALTPSSLDVQKCLIDAGLAAGVQRFVPGELGADMTNPFNRSIPTFQGKVKTAEYIESLAQSNPNFTYTYTYNNVFLDWGIEAGFIVNIKDHTAILVDGGNNPLSMTTLTTVGKAVVGIINNLDATKNRGVYYHDGAFTQTQLINIFKGIDGHEWKTEETSAEECERRAYEALSKNENSMDAILQFVRKAAAGRDHTPDLTSKLDNELLGLKEMDENELRELLRGLASR